MPDTTATTSSAAPRTARAEARRVSMLVGILFGLTGLGSAAAAIALPVMAEDLGVTTGVSAWAISLYALLLAVATAVYGRVSDLVGIRAPLTVGIGLMTAGAVTSALASDFGVLLAARVVQGAGAAAVPTLGVALVSARYAGEVRALALGRIAGFAAAIGTLGPLLGGVTEQFLGWRVPFALPAVGVLVLPLLWRVLPTEGSRARLDLLGAALVGLSATGVVLLLQSPATGATVAAVGATLAVLGVPLTAVWVRRRPDGFLPRSVIGNGTVVRSALAACAVPAAWFALLIAMPAVLVGAGLAPWQVGLAMVPSSVVGFTGPRYAAPLLDRVGAARTLSIGAAVAAVALLVAALGAVSDPAWLATTLLGLAAIGVTVAFAVGQPALMQSVGDAVEPEVRGVALGVATLFFMVGGGLGSAVVAGVGAVLGTGGALVLLAVLPLTGLVALVPEVRRAR